MARRTTVKRGGAKRHPSGLKVRSADLSRAQPLRWVWEGRVLGEYLNMILGEEGIGKGNLAAYIGARLTKGELPGDLLGDPRSVVYVGDEDSWDRIWTPRLEAAGADRARANYIEAGAAGTLDVRTDAAALRDYIDSERVALVYFDQLLDNLGIGTDDFRGKEVRDALAPLRAVARETGAAVLVSLHPNKRRGASFRDLVAGSAQFNALSRSSLYIGRHPSEPGRVVVVRGKGNYGPEPLAFEFRIEPVKLELDEPPRVIVTSRAAHTRETTLTRDDLLDAATSRLQPDSDAGRARAFLAELFADDATTFPQAEVVERGRELGLAERVLQEAHAELELVTWKDGFGSAPWVWGRRRPPKPVRVKTKVKKSH